MSAKCCLLIPDCQAVIVAVIVLQQHQHFIHLKFTSVICICCNAIWLDVEIKITYVCEDNVLIESVSVSCTGWDGKPQNNREGPETGGGLWVPPTPLCQRNPVQTSKWLAWMHTLLGTYCSAHIHPAIWPFFKHGLGYGTFVPSVSC